MASLADPGPRYLTLARDLRQAIARGDFQTGEQLPTEAMLVDRYAVSRFTVREALRRLQAEGLIARRRGSGTTVAPPPTALRQDLSNIAEILQYAHDTRYAFQTLGVLPLGEPNGAALGRDAAEDWFQFAGKRLANADDRTIALTHVFVPLELADAAARVVLSGEPIFQQLEALTGRRVAQVTQDIRAHAADAEAARALGIRKGAPCLGILRTFLDARGRIVEITHSLHPADRFTYAMHIEVAAP